VVPKNETRRTRVTAKGVVFGALVTDDGRSLPPEFARFAETFNGLLDAYVRHTIDAETLAERASAMRVRTADGAEWTMGTTSRKWYRRNGGPWVESPPPAEGLRVTEVRGLGAEVAGPAAVDPFADLVSRVGSAPPTPPVPLAPLPWDLPTGDAHAGPADSDPGPGEDTTAGGDGGDGPDDDTDDEDPFAYLLQEVSKAPPVPTTTPGPVPGADRPGGGDTVADHDDIPAVTGRHEVCPVTARGEPGSPADDVADPETPTPTSDPGPASDPDPWAALLHEQRGSLSPPGRAGAP
jgi:hypothetical protein